MTFLCFATFFYWHIYAFNAHLIYSYVAICICPWHFVLPQLQQQNHMPDLHEGFLEKFNKLSLLKGKCLERVGLKTFCNFVLKLMFHVLGYFSVKILH